MGAQRILGASVPGVEELSPLLHFDAVLEPDNGNLYWLVVLEAVGLDVDSVEVRLEESFSLKCHSVGLGGLELPLLFPERIHVEA